jgi:dUTPase
MNRTIASLLVKKLTSNARLPTKGSPLAAGYDLYSSEENVVPAHGKAIIKTGISIAIPTGNYGRVGKGCLIVFIVSSTFWSCCEEFHRHWCRSH